MFCAEAGVSWSSCEKHCCGFVLGICGRGGDTWRGGYILHTPPTCLFNRPIRYPWGLISLVDRQIRYSYPQIRPLYNHLRPTPNRTYPLPI